MNEPETPDRVASSALLGVEACGLHKRTPYGITNVRMTQFSIARYAGGCKLNGDSYTYLPHTDELIRDDVLTWQRKQKRAAKTPNDPSSATRRAGRNDCNRDAPAGFAAAHG
jgi:hypothetical protein